MAVQAEDAGKSEGPVVMIGIGVQTLPHPKGCPLPMQVWLDRYVEANFNRGSVYNG